ncbi:MAG: hypothetical protein H6754_00860 [Candidatus Omnitrophica bacterium]|nr:hypothetical protein [Candidatus Omnitrophota bacterium]
MKKNFKNLILLSGILIVLGVVGAGDSNAEIGVKLAIPGVTEADIRAALDAAKEIQDQFQNRPTQQLTLDEEKMVRKQADAILALKNEIEGSSNQDVKYRRDLKSVYYSNNLQEGWPALVLREQQPGNKIKFESVTMPFDPQDSKKSFFMAIFKDDNGLLGKIIGQSQQRSGSGNEILLTEAVSNETLYAVIFKDNGDNTFDLMSDLIVRGENDRIIIVKFKVVQ